MILFQHHEQASSKRPRAKRGDAVESVQQLLGEASTDLGPGKPPGGKPCKTRQGRDFTPAPSIEPVARFTPPKKPRGRALGRVVIHVFRRKPRRGQPGKFVFQADRLVMKKA